MKYVLILLKSLSNNILMILVSKGSWQYHPQHSILHAPSKTFLLSVTPSVVAQGSNLYYFHIIPRVKRRYPLDVNNTVS